MGAAGSIGEIKKNVGQVIIRSKNRRKEELKTVAQKAVSRVVRQLLRLEQQGAELRHHEDRQ